MQLLDWKRWQLNAWPHYMIAAHISKIYKLGRHNMPRARSHLHSARPRPSHASFTAQSFCPHLSGNSSWLGTNVTIPGHLSCQAPLACEGTPSINLRIMKVMSTWIFVILTGYYHIGSQRGVPMHVQVGRRSSEGGLGGARTNRMKMWSSPGQKTCTSYKKNDMHIEKLLG